MENRTFIMGDIHGMYDKLMACLQAVSFDYNNDKLIQLGDVVDRGPDSYLVVEELLKIKNLIPIRGNHDDCFYKSMINDSNNMLFSQGGRETLESYIKHCNPDKAWAYKMSGYQTDFEYQDYPQYHVDFFTNQLSYYIDKDNNCFVHGGFNRHEIIENQPLYNLIWDRDLLDAARSYESMLDKTHPFRNKNNFKEIFIGHTPVQYFVESGEPQRFANIWDLDTGCGKGGVLTIMNLETKEYKQF